MTDAVITEYAGTKKNDTIARFYQYGSGGVRVLDGKKKLRRLYLFDPASDMMTERDPARPDRILRRFIFDRMGMLEETFSMGIRPRTFRYEQGGRQIAVREGGEYGQVGKTFTFEGNGIAETGWGRNGELERVYVFEAGNDTITERAGGWFGSVDRTIIFEGIGASLFREPEAFLQFLMFSEWSARDREEDIEERVAKIRGGETATPARSRYAYTGVRVSSSGSGQAAGHGPAPRTPARASGQIPDDSGIDFIPDGDSPATAAPRGTPSRRSDSISYEERFSRDRGDGDPFAAGKSADISIQERFGRSRGEHEPLSKGKSVEIPLEERFSGAREKEQLSRGGSVDIPLDERFESARREREKLSKGKSADIPYSERKSGGNR